MSKKILVSACLIGEKCAYDGEARTSERVKDLCERFGCVAVCPEVDGGLGCPREMHQISGGSGEEVLDGRARVISRSGKDRTDEFMRGAEVALKASKDNSISIAIMKSHSPSCGKHEIHSGNFDGDLREGSGVATSLLKRNGVKVFTEHETEEAFAAVVECEN
jgi:uncharacterized protein YbbK (DUF523 family)